MPSIFPELAGTPGHEENTIILSMNSTHILQTGGCADSGVPV